MSELKENTDFSNEEEVKKLIFSYSRFIPHKIIDLLGKKNITELKLGDQTEKKITIMFSDIRNFTTLSEKMNPQENFNFINSYLSQMEPLISVKDGIIDKFIGDAIMAIFPTTANDALDCSILMQKQLKNYNEGRSRAGYDPINIGIGLNTGISMLGTVGGYNRMDGTVISDAVNLASRIESITKKYDVQLLISEHTYYDIDNPEQYQTRFIDRIFVKGKYQPQSIYEVYDSDPEAIRDLKNATKPTFEEALAHYHYKNIPKARELLNACLAQNKHDSVAKVYLERCEEYSSSGIHEGTKEVDISISWNDSYNTGIDIVDQQHRELLTNSVKLVNAIRGEKSEIEPIIEFLERYVVEHFETEEKYMHEADYPFLENHKLQHSKFVNLFLDLKKEIAAFSLSKIYLMFRTQILVIDWVINHTLEVDKHFGRYLRNRATGTGLGARTPADI